MGEQRIEQGQFVVVLGFVPLGDGAVQRAALFAQHQIVGNLLGNDVFEIVIRLLGRGFERGQIQLLQCLQVRGQLVAIRAHGKNVAQQSQ